MPVSVIPLVRPPVDQDVIDKLKSLLARAESGELSSIAFAYVDREGMTGSEFSEAAYGSQLLGAIAALQYRYASSWLD